MEKEFWIDRWKNKQIGFHQPDYHHFLVKYFSNLKLQKDQTVFLPLCGKTLDIEFFLKNNLNIIGCELAETAIIDLFKQLNLEPQITTQDNFKIYYHNKIKIFVGDFFEMKQEDIGQVQLVYDRAALVALPDQMRINYTSHLTKITQRAMQFLITFDYDQSKIAGPPFAVSSNEVRLHYQNHFQTELLESINLENGMKGVTSATENAWLLKSF